MRKSFFFCTFVRFLSNDPINDPIKSITLIERAIVNIIKEHPSYSRSEIAQQLKVSEATIKRAIQKLINKKLVQRKGSNKNGHWEIIPMTVRVPNSY